MQEETKEFVSSEI